MGLNTVWFVLVGILFGGFFFLEGFDYGVAILLPFLGKKDPEKRVLINSIGPFWDGNEVWMITAGGAMFAAFPLWYATLFSGFYMIMFLILAALIFRGVSFEFRGKFENKTWKNLWDTALFLGSTIPAFLWGGLLTDLVKGVPIDAQMEFVGGIADLFNPSAVAGGLLGVILFTFHGAVFLLLKTEGTVFNKAFSAARKIGAAAMGAVALMILYLLLKQFLFGKLLSGVAILLVFLTLILSYVFIQRKSFKAAMLTSGLSIFLLVSGVFAALYPNVMVSSLDPDLSLTIVNASASGYALKVMTIAAVTVLPVVIGYQVWTYWIFRKRVNTKELEY
jgi:cytochrome bd ubiquinol oxidase subunit II